VHLLKTIAVFSTTLRYKHVQSAALGEKVENKWAEQFSVVETRVVSTANNHRTRRQQPRNEKCALKAFTLHALWTERQSSH